MWSFSRIIEAIINILGNETLSFWLIFSLARIPDTKIMLQVVY
jgi:hypothetical protein